MKYEKKEDQKGNASLISPKKKEEKRTAHIGLERFV